MVIKKRENGLFFLILIWSIWGVILINDVVKGAIFDLITSQSFLNISTLYT
jgi:hypothetical protein